jgi:uncharacterized protein (TIGR02246 family)
MKSLTYLFVWLLLLGMVPGAWAQAPGAAEEIAKLRDQLAKAFTAGDVDAIGALFTDDTQFFGALNPFRMDGKEAVRAYFAGFFQLPTHTLVFRQPSTRIYGDTTAVDNGYFHTTLVDAKGQTTTLFGRYSTTYVKQGGKWVIVNLHGSRLPVSP